MRPQLSGTVTTVLMLTPLILIPALAIFGLPKNRTLDASQTGDDGIGLGSLSIEPGVGQSDFRDPSDLFAPEIPEDKIVAFTDPKSAETPPWDDPFEQTPGLTNNERDNRERWTPPQGALTGWSHDAPSSTAAGNDQDALVALGSSDPDPEPPFGQTKTPDVAGSNSITSGTRSTGQSQTHLTWKQAVAQLNEYGIRHYQLEPGLNGNDFLFRCAYTPASNPRITHRFEAEANEPLKAVEKVLAQVSRWHSMSP